LTAWHQRQCINNDTKLDNVTTTTSTCMWYQSGHQAPNL